MVRWLVLLAFAAAGAGACTLFDEDPPGRECLADSDCFRAQGEVCDQATHECGPRKMDAGIDAPADAGVDAP